MNPADIRRGFHLSRPVMETLSLVRDYCATKLGKRALPIAVEELQEFSAAASALPKVAKTHPSWTTDAMLALAEVISASAAELQSAAAMQEGDDKHHQHQREQLWQIALVGAIETLAVLADSEARTASMVAAGIPGVITDTVFSASIADESAVRSACKLMKHMADCPTKTAPAMCRCGAMSHLVKVAIAPIRDETALAAAVAARLLLEKAATSSPDAGGSDAAFVVPWLALEVSPFVKDIIALEGMANSQLGQSLHAELARVVAVATVHIVNAVFEVNQESKWKQNITHVVAQDEMEAHIQQQRIVLLESYSRKRRPQSTTPSVVYGSLILLAGKTGCEFIAYLLASSDPELHALALRAYLALRRAHRGFWSIASHSLAPNTSGATGLAVGDAIEVFGMEAHTNMNGVFGSVESFNVGSKINKCNVKLDNSGEVFSVPQVNIYRRGPDGKPKSNADTEASEWEAAMEAAWHVEKEILALKGEPFQDTTTERMAKLETLRGPELQRLVDEDPLFVGALVSGTPLRERLQQLRGPPGARLPNAGALRVLLTGGDTL